LAGYTRARPVAHWLDFPDTTYGTVGSAEFGKWDTAIYELKTLAANPLDFGAVGGGGDETAILNNALASGKDVFLPPGYVFGTTGITVSTVGQRIFGGGTIRLLGGGSLVGISVAATDVSVDGIILDQQNILNSVGVELTGAAQRCRVFGNRFTNYKVAGVHLAGACSDLLIQGNRYNGQGYGILSADASTCARVAVIGNVLVGGVYGDGIEFNTPTGGATDIVIVGNTVYGYTSAGPNDGIGIGFAHVIGGLIADNLVYNCGLDGIHLEDGSAGVTISGNTVRGCGRSGIAVNSGNAARLTRDMVIADNEVSVCASTSGSAGIAVEGTQSSPGHVINGNVSRGNGRAGATCYGILIGGAGSKNMTVVGNAASNTVGSTTAGIAFSDTTDCAVSGNRCYDDQGVKTQQYGIQSIGSSDFLVVTGNNCRGNATGSVSLVGSNNVNASNL
jgi:parallel beta-helix repeat protein